MRPRPPRPGSGRSSGSWRGGPGGVGAGATVAAPLPLILGIVAAFGTPNRAAAQAYDYGAESAGAAQLRGRCGWHTHGCCYTARAAGPGAGGTGGFWGVGRRPPRRVHRLRRLSPRATGASDQTFLDEMPQRSNVRDDRSQYLSDKAKQYSGTIRPAAKLALIKAGRTWSPAPLSPQTAMEDRAVGLATRCRFRTVLAGLWGRRLGAPAKCFYCYGDISNGCSHALGGVPAYRLPAEPPMAVIAASVLATPSWVNGARGRDSARVMPNCVKRENVKRDEGRFLTFHVFTFHARFLMSRYSLSSPNACSTVVAVRAPFPPAVRPGAAGLMMILLIVLSWSSGAILRHRLRARPPDGRKLPVRPVGGRVQVGGATLSIFEGCGSTT